MPIKLLGSIMNGEQLQNLQLPLAVASRVKVSVLTED
jgi:hypothetical protein